MDTEYKYLTSLPGTGGRIRVELEDFQVDEAIPFEASGDGEHYLVRIEKRGLPTLDAIRDLARALGISQARFGYGGLKDARAVARQYLSVWSLQDLSFPDLPGITILEAKRHRTKLKPGTVKTNTFTIIVREAREGTADEILKTLYEKGVPNYFGPQRFGSRRPNTHLVGEKIVKGDIDGALNAFIGNPYPTESPDLQDARRLFDQGALQESMQRFPRKFYQEKAAIDALIHGKTPKEAFMTIPQRLRRLFVHAYQSHLFNQILDERIERPDPLEGDILRKGRPTGPLFGYKVPLATGTPGEIERRVLDEAGVRLEDFRCPAAPDLACDGERHPLFFNILDYSVEHDPLTLRFTLSRGCYATSVLREVMKNDQAI